MKRSVLSQHFLMVLAVGWMLAALPGCTPHAETIERPQEIVSKRITILDPVTYDQLVTKWEAYYNTFPSENAYANWMYAARYAGRDNYAELLDKGVERYPANPTLLYLKSMTFPANTQEALDYVERAIFLAPDYSDPWFNLVIESMAHNQPERTQAALAKLLELGAIRDATMDYNYNMLVGLRENAILITNGDNDTYPCWILQQVLKFRADVTVINRSLLGATWYPALIIEQGAPPFIPLDQVEAFHQEHAKETSDQLILRIIEAAERLDRPVYFAATLFNTPVLESTFEEAPLLGLSLLVTDPEKSVEDERERITGVILNEYRTGGLDSWSMRHARAANADISISRNYFYLTYDLATHSDSRATRGQLFVWWRDHVSELFDMESRDNMVRAWCTFEDVPEIHTWCTECGYLE